MIRGALVGEATRYVAVGLATFAVFAGVNAGLLAATSWAPGLVTGIAVVAASLVNFFGQARVTFRTSRGALSMAPGYVALLLFNAALAGFVVTVGVERFGLSLTMANAVALVFVTLSSFFLMKYVVMSARGRHPSP